VLSTPAYLPDICEVIRTDHSQTAADLERLVACVDSYERRHLFRALARRLAVHEGAEEEVVYPLLARMGGDADRIRQRRLEEEREAKVLLAAMMRRELLNPASRHFVADIEKLADMVRIHAAAEESEVLPLLAEAHDETKRRVLATLFDQAKATAPTRPHPHGPQALAGLLATGPVLAVVDRVRDLGRRVLVR
ncbi:MAG TPA: hemerythrin domain-containing protein, partial [Acidimicrobiales bacterium]|nr:hemerythrin domain-containing protein [Acidimicrobiales bacterium]